MAGRLCNFAVCQLFSRKVVDVIMKTEWIRCPVCGNKTRVKLRDDSVLKNFPLYCPKCKQEILIETKKTKVIIIKEP